MMYLTEFRPLRANAKTRTPARPADTQARTW